MSLPRAWLRFILAPLIVLSLLLAAGCAGDNQLDTDEGDQQCFVEPDAAQRAQLQQQLTQNGNTSTTGDTVCVINSRGEQHYYNQNDGNSDYLLYLALLGRSNTLLTYGAMTGQIDPMDALIFSMLIGVDSYGTPYHYYSPLNGGGYGRHRSPVAGYENVRVTNVYYGNSRQAVPYEQARSRPKAGYKWRPAPKASDKVATSDGHGGVKTVPGQKASTVVKKSKFVATKSKYQNPQTRQKADQKQLKKQQKVEQKKVEQAQKAQKKQQTQTGPAAKPKSNSGPVSKPKTYSKPKTSTTRSRR